MHCHKSITVTLDTIKIAKRFSCANELRKGHFGKFEQGYALGLVHDEPPPPPYSTFQNAPPPLFKLYTTSVVFKIVYESNKTACFIFAAFTLTRLSTPEFLARIKHVPVALVDCMDWFCGRDSSSPQSLFLFISSWQNISITGWL